MRRGSSGLVMIELLTVIAIIAILAAILFPTFARCREKARQASCLNNLTQIALALHLYAQDHGGKFPPTDNDFTPIYPVYLREPQSFTCPSVSDGYPLGPTAPGAAAGGNTSSYVYRGGLKADGGAKTAVAADWKADVHNGGANVLFADGMVRWVRAPEWQSYAFTVPPAATPPGPPGGMMPGMGAPGPPGAAPPMPVPVPPGTAGGRGAP